MVENKSDEPNAEHISLARMVQKFNRMDRLMALGVMTGGILCTILGVVCFRMHTGHLQSGGIPLMMLGVFVVWYGNLMRLRSQRALSHFPASQDAHTTYDHYLESLDEHCVLVKRTQDVSAIVVALAIVGLVISCLVDSLISSAGAWLAIAAVSGLLSIVAYTHVFRLEIHAQDVRRKLRVED